MAGRPQRRNDPQRRLADIICLVAVTDMPPAQVNGLLDASKLERWMVDDLRAAEASTRRLRQQIEMRLAGDERVCSGPGCEAALTGRADQQFCSTKCRVAAHRVDKREAARIAEFDAWMEIREAEGNPQTWDLTAENTPGRTWQPITDYF